MKPYFDNRTKELRLIDYMPGWSLYIFNPPGNINNNSHTCIIYVELTKYKHDKRDRPVFRLDNQDQEYLNMFLREFNDMWAEAENFNIYKESLKVCQK